MCCCVKPIFLDFDFFIQTFYKLLNEKQMYNNLIQLQFPGGIEE